MNNKKLYEDSNFDEKPIDNGQNNSNGSAWSTNDGDYYAQKSYGEEGYYTEENQNFNGNNNQNDDGYGYYGDGNYSDSYDNSYDNSSYNNGYDNYDSGYDNSYNNGNYQQNNNWNNVANDVDDWDSVTGNNGWRPQVNSSVNDSYGNIPTNSQSQHTNNSTPFKKRQRKSLPAEKDTFKENVITITIAIIIAMIVRTFWVEPFTIPSGSMLPTLQIGDYIFVSKPSYGYSRYSLPFGLPLINERIQYTEPEIGDIAVFKLPSDTSVNYIKRIVGLPGDTVQVFNGRLILNGKMLERKEVGKDFVTVADGKYRSVTEYIETLPNGKQHSIFEMSDSEPFDNTKIFQVPYGFVFAMGDNRDNSLDSRTDEVSFIPIENLVGKARYIFFSKTPEFSWLKFWQWLSEIRFERIGSEVE